MIVRSNQELNNLMNGKNLVVNGDFSQGLAGWRFDSYATQSIVNGRLRLTQTSTVSWSTVEQTIPTIAGNTYEITVGIYDGTSAGAFYISIPSLLLNYTTQGVSTVKVVATTTSMVVKYINKSTVAGQYAEFGAMSVKEIPQVQGENLPDYVASRSNFGFKNYIINGGFDVNQRGLTSYVSTTSKQYTFDRWNLVSAGQKADLTANASGANAVRVTRNTATSGYQSFRTYTELPKSLKGKVMTLSGKIKFNATSSEAYVAMTWKSSTDVSEGTVYNRQWSEFGVNSSLLGVEQKFKLTFTLQSDASTYHSYLFTFLGNGATGTLDYDFELSEIQLEEGSVATPFEHRPYGLELSLCQRYYRLNDACAGCVSGTTTMSSFAINIADMRVQPTVAVINGTGAVVKPGAYAYDISGTPVVHSTRKYLEVTTTVAGTVAEGRFLNANTLSFSAEL